MSFYDKLFVSIPLAALLVALPPLAQAHVTNDIHIDSNTGGNTVSGQSGSKITTGDTSTSVDIDNQTGTSSSESSSTTTTNININTSGEGDNQVDVRVGKQQFHLRQQGDQATLETTDSQGNKETRTIDTDQQLNIDLGDTNLHIMAADGEFALTHESTTAVTTEPLDVDTQTGTVSISKDGSTFTIEKLPETIKNQILDNYLQDLTDMLFIHIDNGQIVYSTSGTINRRLVGLIPVKVNKTVIVSASTGDLIDSHFNSFQDRLVNALSL